MFSQFSNALNALKVNQAINESLKNSLSEKDNNLFKDKYTRALDNDDVDLIHKYQIEAMHKNINCVCSYAGGGITFRNGYLVSFVALDV